MTKTINVDVDIRIARIMLNVAGYNSAVLKEKSDDEIFFMAIDMCHEYGVTVSSFDKTALIDKINKEDTLLNTSGSESISVNRVIGIIEEEIK